MTVGAALVLLGCGSSTSEVKGVVTLDGKPVEGAMVLFTGDDGTLASGFTDANGNFELVSGPNGAKGAPPGTYRAIVTKVKTMEGAISPKEAAEASGGDSSAAAKQMAKMAKANKSVGGSGPPGAGPPKAGPPKGGSGTTNNQLPEMYGSPDLSPFKGIKVPTDGPVKLDMTSGSGGGPGGPPGGPPGKK